MLIRTNSTTNAHANPMAKRLLPLLPNIDYGVLLLSERMYLTNATTARIKTATISSQTKAMPIIIPPFIITYSFFYSLRAGQFKRRASWFFT